MINRAKGFTVIELLVVIGLIVLLLSLALPAVHMAREASRHADCQNRMRQVALAVSNFHDRHKRLPRQQGHYSVLVHWFYLVLPDLEKSPLYDKIHSEIEQNQPWDSLSGSFLTLPEFQCPSDPSAGMLRLHKRGVVFSPSNYFGIVGTDYAKSNGVFPDVHKPNRRFSDVTDGLSNTLLLSERPLTSVEKPIVGVWQSSQEYGSQWLGVREDFRSWVGSNSMYFYFHGRLTCPDTVGFAMGRLENECDQFHPWSLHGSGANFAFADCSIQFVSTSIDERIIDAMATIAENEVIGTE
jgi:prepilin-type N-terminal cleavage/methylation domain-containing protein/prepilin-type processing-associated H-X9-DG protein